MTTTQLLGVLISLAALPFVQSQAVITQDSYFYGESPYVPPPNATGTGYWASAYAKARTFVAQLSLDEKVNLTAGYQDTANGCAGNIAANPRVGFPGLCLQDAGNGVRATDFVSGYPSGLHIGASWNKDLANQRGIHMGGEFRAKGVNIALGPVISPLGRMAEGGRNWEGFSNDPYLCGALAGQAVSGIQSNGVITSTKHYIAYEQETNRNPATNRTTGQTVQSVSSNVDDQTPHEIYLWPFADAVHAGTGNIMCSYNRINNSYGCQNSKTLNGILKDELGYQGFVVSDWGAQHAGVASAVSGLDMAMPSSSFWGPNLTAAVQNGSVPEYRLDDMVTRIIAAWYQMGQESGYPTPGVGMPFNMEAPHPIVNARSPASVDTLLQGAIEGHVLVKNVNNSLPLKNPAMLSIFGYDAKVPDQYDVGSSWTGGGEPDVGYSTQQYAGNGTMVSGGGSGAVTPPYISSPFDALAQQAINDGTALFWDFDTVNATSNVDGATTACLVFINAWASEGQDRPGLHDAFSDNLVNNIAANCSNTIVVIHNAGIRLVDQWIENPNVTAVIFAHLPGQDSGRALVQILYGEASPSGKLPYTVAKNESDYGPLLAPSLPEGEFVYFPQSNFTEGLLIDYRRFDALGITPRFEFGFGLSYTTFDYSSLSIQTTNSNPSIYPTGPILQGGNSDLWNTVVRVAAVVENTGAVTGAEAVQLYVGNPAQGQPVKQLRGFEKVTLKPGESQMVTFELLRRDLSMWDTDAQKWALQNGQYQIYVGSSSRDLPLSGSLSLYH